ncbi:hypothetical protein MKX08_000111 [Trichoderma sp. CBMAI-0020]|nr:hypothetical protein MKX08_000111 [Trichoderma sp. CBMAI-0020]
MDAKEASDWFKISAMTPNLRTTAAASHTFSMRLSVGRHQQQYVLTIIVPSRYTPMSERPAVKEPPPVWSHQDLVWRRRLASSQSLHRQRLIALLARPGHHPPQLPSGDPCLIVMRLVYSKSPRKAGTARFISGRGPLRT